ncbi:hypothetical protein ACNPL4_15465, partial [Enterococcus faecium]|nr:hypothetical protein [Enterococcus faecium]MDQ8546736.1 hypothetical protein [Enterococcus faecium]
LSQNEVHSDPDLILYNPSVLIDKEPKKTTSPPASGFWCIMNYLFVKTIIPYFLKNTINRRIIITTLMKKADINFSFIFIMNKHLSISF